jgi:hypothetical protein
VTRFRQWQDTHAWASALALFALIVGYTTVALVFMAEAPWPFHLFAGMSYAGALAFLALAIYVVPHISFSRAKKVPWVLFLLGCAAHHVIHGYRVTDAVAGHFHPIPWPDWIAVGVMSTAAWWALTVSRDRTRATVTSRVGGNGVETRDVVLAAEAVVVDSDDPDSGT